jgi:hypothetical protein
MTLKIHRFDGNVFIINCISFEIRSNLVGSWIKCKTSDDKETIFDGISKIETVEESIKK